MSGVAAVRAAAGERGITRPAQAEGAEGGERPGGVRSAAEDESLDGPWAAGPFSFDE